ncbi:FAD binding domain-containing protein [Aspergillus steynii IBT 23096]|uniref:FAD binding domain-containing protein n=1 Tax=Aspergillus steynii IBT 23096 TaxID=1392250 RepID=A0A2I2G3M1_9EURO|nr:FAD binding domain-containing protein [Aspergillus steynii IBT 23096]PLB47470.1 FAD binding domain-containing protein [Aspergillus steynii IBT 23096]
MKSPALALTAVLVVEAIAAASFDFENRQLRASDLQHLDEREAAIFRSDQNATVRSSCKVFPGDRSWPRPRTWDLLDKLTDGGLIASVPRASSCYSGPRYDADDCKLLTDQWTDSYFHNNDPIEMLSPVYQGLTCQPTTNPKDNCTLGGYPAYAVNVSSVADVQLAINFARHTGVRLVVKNTGHDFSGKSGGAGALSIWTHNLKGIEHIPEYSAPGTNWTGAAFRVGAGVQAYELYKAADDYKLMAVGGEGRSGYVLGGGHSPLSSLHGLAADQVLSMQVVLPDGQFVTASFTENIELFWALRGGGGSTFGIVTSVTVKAFPTIPATSSTFTWSTGANLTHENFWAGFRAYLDLFIQHSDAGIYSYFFILPSDGEFTFLMQPFFAPNKTVAETNALLSPWFKRLHELGIQFTPKTQYFNTFYEAWNASFPLEVVEKTHVATGSRLFPRANWEDESKLNATFSAIRASSEAGLTYISFNMAPTLARGGNPDNAVNPAWRKAVMHALSSVNWSDDSPVSEIKEARHNFTYGHMQRWRDVSPGAGSYLGESDRMEPDFQQSFYGDHYDRLLRLKRKLDPYDVFWAATAVGSDRWTVKTEDGLPTENGKLCRISPSDI